MWENILQFISLEQSYSLLLLLGIQLFKWSHMENYSCNYNCSYSVVSECVLGGGRVCLLFPNHEINEYTLTSQSNNHRWWLIFIVPTSVCWPLWKATGKRESFPRAQLGHRQPHKSSTLILPDSPLLANAPNWMLCILGLLHLRHMLSGAWITDCLTARLSVSDSYSFDITASFLFFY